MINLGNDVVSERSFTRIVWYTLFLMIGGIIYALGDFHIAAQYIDDPLKDLGTAIFSGVVVAVLFGWIAERVLNARLQIMIHEELQSFVKPHVELSVKNFLRDYEWDCTLVQVSEDDILPEYFYQNVSISFYAKLPRELKFIGAISNDDDALKEYFDDQNVFLRWPMTIYDPLPNMIRDERVFKMGNVVIDNKKISKRPPTIVKTAGGDAVIHSYANPNSLNKISRLEFDFTVRKKSSLHEPIQIITRIYRHVTNATFRLHVGKDISASEITVFTTETASLYEDEGRLELKSIKEVNNNKIGASAKFIYPLLPGSNIRFEIRRNLKK